VKIGSLFSGAGGLDMAVAEVFGGQVVWHSELDPAASKVLAHRWPNVPNLGDITKVDWDQVEPVDVLCGGFPCQDVSAAGKRAGIKDGTRSGLWAIFADAIDHLRPRVVVVENVRGLLSAEAHRNVEPRNTVVGDGPGRPVLRAAGAVLGDLADLGYDAQWTTVAASTVGAPHRRERVFIVATQDGNGGGRFNSVGHQSTLPGTVRELLPTPRRSDGDGGPNPLHRAERMDDVETRVIRMDGQWGKYEPAIRRWEQVTRPAPSPTEPNTKGNPRLAAAFSEWMMGWPAGWVTNMPGISRNDQLRIVGNGVVPQQAVAALRWLLSVQEVAA
jgi:DNA (cytosine-5)-methyltransferase 1